MTARPAYAIDAPSGPSRPPMINRASRVPYYAQLAGILRERIATGEYEPGASLPSENELCSAFGLSRTVVRQAFGELAAEGLVQKEKGRRSYVSAPKLADLVVQELRGFLDEMTSRGHAITTTVLDASLGKPPQHVATDLGLPPGAKAVHLARMRAANGDPIVKVDTYLPSRFASVLRSDLAASSLYDILRESFGVHPKGGWRRIEAAVASHELAGVLGVDIGSPMLELTAVTTDADGTPFEYFRAYYRGDRTSFEIRVDGDLP